MGKPLTSDEMRMFSGFLKGIFKGTIELGFGTVPMVQLYNRAREHGTSFIDLLVADPDTATEIVKSLRKQATKLPPVVLVVLKQIISQAQREQERVPVRAQAACTGDDEDDV